jgi:hypothetical protein
MSRDTSTCLCRNDIQAYKRMYHTWRDEADLLLSVQCTPSVSHNGTVGNGPFFLAHLNRGAQGLWCVVRFVVPYSHRNVNT